MTPWYYKTEGQGVNGLVPTNRYSAQITLCIHLDYA